MCFSDIQAYLVVNIYFDISHGTCLNMDSQLGVLLCLTIQEKHHVSSQEAVLHFTPQKASEEKFDTANRCDRNKCLGKV